MRSRILALACLGALQFATADLSAETKQSLRIATEGAYPPFNYVDSSGAVGGFEIEFSKLLCKRMNVQCEFVVQDWDGIIPGLLVKKYDAIVAAMSITPERKKAIDFTDPYYRAYSLFIVEKGSSIDGTPSTVEGKTIGVQRASTDANYLAKVYGDNVKTVAYDTVENLYLDLKAGRIDAALLGRIAGHAWTSKSENSKYQQVGQPVYDPEIYGPGVGIGVRKGESDLKEALNKAIAEVLDDGSYDALSRKYFPFSIRPDGK